MNFRRLPIRTLLLALAAVTTHAQTPNSTPITPKRPRPKTSQQLALNPNIVLLDPAHGGPDNGANLASDSIEKDVTVAFAERLKATLTARGFTVILTHESAGDQPTPDQRAELANHSRAGTCLLLHASSAGHGIHLFTSSLTPISPLSANFEGAISVLPWATAQAMSLQQSLRLTFDLSDAIHAIRLPLVVGHASPAPIDSMTCPAVAIELAPLTSEGTSTPASDAGYQQQVTDAVANALSAWRTKLTGEAAPAAPPTSSTPKPATPPPVKKVKPIVPPVETPDIIPDPKAPPKPTPAPEPPPATKTGVQQ